MAPLHRLLTSGSRSSDSGPRLGRYTMYLPFDDWRAPFTPDFKCFYGDQWFAGNQKAAEILLNPTDKQMQFRRHLRSSERCLR